jgi:hypothetical protein
MTQLERKEMEVLDYTGLTELPGELDPDGPIWVKAIAKVTTQTNTASYAVVYNDAAPEPKIVRVFDTCGVARIDALHPYEFLASDAVPAVKTVEEARSAVINLYGADPEAVKDFSKKKLLALLLRYALRRQIEKGKPKVRTAPYAAEPGNNEETTSKDNE